MFKLTNGRVGNKWRIGAGWKKPVPTLLLTHVGRKSGKRFETPLLYLEDGRDLVVVASQGGLPKNPQWYANLLAHPDTTVSLKGERDRPVRARTVTPGRADRAVAAAGGPVRRLREVPEVDRPRDPGRRPRAPLGRNPRR